MPTHNTPAGRAPAALPALVFLLASLPTPAHAFWYSRSCVLAPASNTTSGTGVYQCSGLSYSAGAGIGVGILFFVLLLIFLTAFVNRPRYPLADVEEIWVAPAGVFVSTPVGPNAVHAVPVQMQMQQVAAGPGPYAGVYPWMPTYVRSQQAQAQAEPQQPPTPGPGAGPYPQTIPEQTPRSAGMRDIPLDSGREPQQRDGDGDGEKGAGMAQDVWRTPGTPRIVVSDWDGSGRKREAAGRLR